MKYKLLTAITLSTISLNAFAFRVISEHITITPGFVGGFISVDEKKTSPNVSSARVFVSGKSGKVMEYIKIDANHSINILNRDNRTNRYSYHYTLKCGDGEAKYDRTIEIEANGRFQNASYSYLAIQKAQPGDYRIEAKTSIDGADSENARDSASLNVYK